MSIPEAVEYLRRSLNEHRTADPQNPRVPSEIATLHNAIECVLAAWDAQSAKQIEVNASVRVAEEAIRNWRPPHAIHDVRNLSEAFSEAAKQVLQASEWMPTHDQLIAAQAALEGALELYVPIPAVRAALKAARDA